MKKVLFLLSAMALVCACSDSDSPKEGIGYGSYPSTGGGEASGGAGEGEAGKVTAGEWRDLDNWLFWSDLMTTPYPAEQTTVDYTTMSEYWHLYTNNRVAVRVLDAENVPQRDVPVRLKRVLDSGPTVLYEARTDNRGEVNLWIGLTQKEDEIDTTQLRIEINGIAQSEPVAVTHWQQIVKWNTYTATLPASTRIDIAFIVDATGSMSDEISFLKKDLMDIINKVSQKHAEADIRTAALFYRDYGDTYLTRVNDFVSDPQQTVNFIKQQSAEGGGDYPEAVDVALETGLQKLSWREDNSIRLAFLLLDAPPHHEDDVIQSLHTSIPKYAKQGIRIIPIAASGVDKYTEFFLRFTAMVTDGTYVFITNDSGIGNEHIAPTIGEYKVEVLNDLIVRLIEQYLEK